MIPNVIYFLQNLLLHRYISQEYLVELSYLTKYATSVAFIATQDKIRKIVVIRQPCIISPSSSIGIKIFNSIWGYLSNPLCSQAQVMPLCCNQSWLKCCVCCVYSWLWVNRTQHLSCCFSLAIVDWISLPLLCTCGLGENVLSFSSSASVSQGEIVKGEMRKAEKEQTCG